MSMFNFQAFITGKIKKMEETGYNTNYGVRLDHRLLMLIVKKLELTEEANKIIKELEEKERLEQEAEIQT
jgi:hypothetical protein